MKRKIPPEAFQYYVSLGIGRSYRAVGEHYGASKRAVLKVARKEKWQERLAQAEAEVKRRSEERAIESLTDVNIRHLKTLKVVEAKALKSLTAMPHSTAGEAARTLLSAMQQERGIHQMPGGTGQVVLNIITGVPRGPAPPDKGDEPPFLDP